MKTRGFIALFMFIVFAAIVSSCYEDDRYGELVTYRAQDINVELVVDLDIRHIEIIAIDQEHISLTYHEHEDDTWQFTEHEGKMTIRQDRKNTFHFFRFGTAEDELVQLKVYLPITFNGSMELFTAVGRIEIVYEEMLELQALDVHTNVGEIILENIDVSEDLMIDSSTGDVSVEHVIADTTDVCVSTGSISVVHLQTNDLRINSTTGFVNVTGSVVSGDLDVGNSTGDIVIEDTTAFSYDLHSSTGSITMNLSASTDFSFDLETTLGDVTVFGVDQGRKHVTKQGDIPIKARVSTGSITINRDE